MVWREYIVRIGWNHRCDEYCKYRGLRRSWKLDQVQICPGLYGGAEVYWAYHGESPKLPCLTFVTANSGLKLVGQPQKEHGFELLNGPGGRWEEEIMRRVTDLGRRDNEKSHGRGLNGPGG